VSRKSRLKKNLGGTVAQDDPRFSEKFFEGGPAGTEIRTSIAFPERLIRAVLFSEVERLSKDKAEVERFFSHFFDPTAAPGERDSYVTDFLRNPPIVTMGYPRFTGDMPIFSIVLSSDEEADGEGFLGNYVGQTMPGEKPPGGDDQEYEGALFNQQNSIYVFAQHPDQLLYLYQFAKLVLLGAREALHCAGMISPTYSGGELAPNEVYLPDNVFGRVLNVSYKVMMTVPKLFSYRDGRRLRVTGIFGKDIVVDGQRGGVVTYDEGDEDGE